MRPVASSAGALGRLQRIVRHADRWPFAAIAGTLLGGAVAMLPLLAPDAQWRALSIPDVLPLPPLRLLTATLAVFIFVPTFARLLAPIEALIDRRTARDFASVRHAAPERWASPPTPLRVDEIAAAAPALRQGIGGHVSGFAGTMPGTQSFRYDIEQLMRELEQEMQANAPPPAREGVAPLPPQPTRQTPQWLRDAGFTLDDQMMGFRQRG